MLPQLGEQMAVIVRNTFIDVELPPDPKMARRTSSLPHKWRFRDCAGCQPVITDLDATTEPIPTSSQFAAHPSSPIAPGKSTKAADLTFPWPIHPSISMAQLNALDLSMTQLPTSVGAKVSATRMPTKSLTVTAPSQSSKLKPRSRSHSSDGSVGSTESTGSGSGSGGSTVASVVSISSSEVGGTDSPPVLPNLESISGLPNPEATPGLPNLETISGSRRSRRRRATARKAAELLSHNSPDRVEHVPLRIHAPLFRPAAQEAHTDIPLLGSIPEDVLKMVMTAQASILGCPHVHSVRIGKPISHNTQNICVAVSFDPGKVWAHDVRNLAKHAVLEAAETSQQVFIVGYDADPFRHESDAGFGVTIGCVAPKHQNAICWDVFQKGFCSRPSTCRWNHPVFSDFMQVAFVLNESHAP